MLRQNSNTKQVYLIGTCKGRRRTVNRKSRLDAELERAKAFSARQEARLIAYRVRVTELETALREIADFGKHEPVLYGNDEWFVNIARRAIGEGK